MNVDVSKINKGDKVKIILYGLPESGWLEVTDVHVNSGLVQVRVPSPGTGPDGGEARWLYPNDRTALFTAHKPAAPALPEWWGSLVILAHEFTPHGHCVYDPEFDTYRDVNGDKFGSDDRAWSLGAVHVVVDRDGNQPAVAQAEAERDEARADLEAARSYRDAERERRARDGADLVAFRAKVATLRNDVPSLTDYQIDQRLSAILDGTDQ